MKRRQVAAAALSLVALRSRRSHAQAVQPTVVELFTSQSCSSCPPADTLLTELTRDRLDLLPLSFHVTYWNRLGWRDRFSLQAATERQRRYARTLSNTAVGPGQLYTPQIVVQGRRDAVGSNRAAVLAAIAATASGSGRSQVAAGLAVQEGAVEVSVGAGVGAGSLWLIGFDRHHVTQIGAGENVGRTLAHSNVVRSIVSAGTWDGQPARAAVPRPDGERLALLVQAADGLILGAALAG